MFLNYVLEFKKHLKENRCVLEFEKHLKENQIEKF